MKGGIHMPIDIIQYLYDTFIRDGLLIIIACYVIGNIITKGLPKINNNHTVPILSVTGVVLVFSLGTFVGEPVGTRVVKGFILGWSSTGLHELIKSFVRFGYIKIPGYSSYVDNKKCDYAGSCGENITSADDPGG